MKCFYTFSIGVILCQLKLCFGQHTNTHTRVCWSLIQQQRDGVGVLADSEISGAMIRSNVICSGLIKLPHKPLNMKGHLILILKSPKHRHMDFCPANKYKVRTVKKDLHF